MYNTALFNDNRLDDTWTSFWPTALFNDNRLDDMGTSTLLSRTHIRSRLHWLSF